MQSDFLYNPSGVGSFAHCPSFLRAADGSEHVVWYAYPEDEARDAVLIAVHRASDRIAWGAPQLISIPVHSSLGNPVIYEPCPGTLEILFVVLKGPYWTDAVLHRIQSQDGGRVWSKPLQVYPKRGTVVRHAPIRCSSGAWLIPAYDDDTRTSLYLEPGSAEFGVRSTVTANQLIQPSLVRDQRGRLVAFYRPTDESRVIWRNESLDDGRSWSAPERLPLPCPLSGVAAFIHERMLGVIHNHTLLHQRYPLSISFSRDDGKTWMPPVHLETAPHEFSYPAVHCDADGTIRLVYTFNRRMIKYVRASLEELARGA